MIPQATRELPDLMEFIQQMHADYRSGVFAGWQDFAKRVRAWYTPERLQQIDGVVTGWQKMSTYADQQTLIHLTAALVSLLSLPEYQMLSAEQQNLALWIVLYHDVDKEAHHDKHDLTHGFRSAAVCGTGIAAYGFVEPVDPAQLADWHDLTMHAVTDNKRYLDKVQDNRKLPDIMAGIDEVFSGRDSSAGLIVSGVLFHMSLDVVDDYPQAAPLTDDQIQVYISPSLFPLLQTMMLTDCDAWSMFNPPVRAMQHQQAHREFNRVKTLLSL